MNANECRMVAVSAASLPPTAPRYLMGVGHQVIVLAFVPVLAFVLVFAFVLLSLSLFLSLSLSLMGVGHQVTSF